jgi:hypothetical protein
MKRHVTCFVEKARFEPRTLGTKAERYDHCATRPVDNSDTHDSSAGRGPASTRPQGCASARPARPARHTTTTAPVEDRKTGGATSYTVAASVVVWRLRAVAFFGGPEPGELQATQLLLGLETSRGGAGGGPEADRSRRISREPAAGVMDRRRSCQSSDLEGRRLHTVGL